MILTGDALKKLRTLPDKSIQMCVTSPPYWGLRDYKMDGQLGLEPTLEAYVASLVTVFREVRRVLKNDGTLWLNIGDSYATNGGHADSQVVERRAKIGAGARPGDAQREFRCRPGQLKSKDLCMIPARVALALQADGWWLRSDIIWHKPNPMPESVTDRPTKSHEYLFLLSKSARYFYDADAIKEPASADTHARYARGRGDSHKWSDGGPGNQTIATNKPGSLFARIGREGRNSRMHISRDANHPTELAGKQRAPGVNPKCAAPGSGIKQNSSFSAAVKDVVEFRNKRTVWTLATNPYKGAHFATFPPKLIEPCILAGSRPGDVVLDPFGGAFTTALVARQHGRDFVIIELSPAYVKLGNARLRASKE